MDTVTFIDSNVIAFSPDLIWVKVHAEQDSATAAKYHANNYPTVILANSDGTEIDRIVGYLPPDEFLTEIKNYLQGMGTLDDLLQKAATTPDGQMYMTIAGKYQYRGMNNEAVEYYNKIMALDPENKNGLVDDAMLAIGEVFTGQKEYDKALEQYNSVMARFKGDSSEASAMVAIGGTYLRMKEYDKAINQFNDIMIKYQGTDQEADAILWKGYIYRKMPDTLAAIKTYEEFLTKFPQHPDTAHAKERLASLKNPPPPVDTGH